MVLLFTKMVSGGGGAHMLMEYTKDNSLGQDVLGSSNTAFQPVW